MRTLRLPLAALALGALTLGACNRADGPEATTTDAVSVTEASGTALAIDTSASAIGFRGTKVTGGHDGGFHVFDGQITATDSAVTGVRLNIAMPSIWTDTEKLTGHLQSADFFDVATYPAATFESSEIVRRDTAGATHLVTGNLTMHGATQAITFPATITRAAGMASAKASFVIDRTKWGVLYTGAADNLISNDVTIRFDVTARDGMAAPMADSSMAAGSAAPAAGATGEAPPAAPEIESMGAKPKQ